MSISNYAELKILDHTTGRAAWTAPSAVYLKLHLGDAGEDGTLNPASEVTRRLVSWSAAGSGSISSSGVVEWTNVAASETYTHWSMWDASTAGNCLWTGSLSSAASVVAGDTFQVTSISLSLD